MPHLGDFLGHVLSEITIARMQADLEALRVADFYASHPLLRTMPVPRFRLPDVEVDIPIVIDRLDEPREGESPRGGVTSADLRSAFDRVMADQLEKHHIRIAPEQTQKIRATLDDRIATLSLPVETAVDVNRVARDLARAVSRVLGESEQPDERIERVRLSKFEAELKEAARVEFLRVRKPPPRLHVLVRTSEVREAGPSDIIGRLSLKITEQNVEWTLIESDGETQDRLVPE